MIPRWVRFLAVATLLAAGCATVPPRTPFPGPGGGADGGPQQTDERRAALAAQVDAAVAEARAAFVAGDYRRAADAAQAATRLDPARSEPRVLEARAREATGELAAALSLWQSLVRDRVGGVRSLYAYASLAERLGQAMEALAVLEELPAASADDSERHGVAGWLALAGGSVTEARKHLELTRDSPVADRYALHLARARYLEGDLSGAAAALGAPGAGTQGPAAAVLLGDVRWAQGLVSAAVDAYRLALEADPENYPARVNLGVLLLTQGDAPGAAAQFQAAAEARPEAPEAWNDLGLARRAMGDFPAAREAYQRALRAAPDFLPALKNLGILNEKYLGDPAAALPYYDRFLNHRSEDEDVRRWRKAAARLAREEPS